METETFFPDFVHTVPFVGDVTLAYQTGLEVLEQAGFRILRNQAPVPAASGDSWSWGEIRAAGEGLRGRWAEPLRGATLVQIRISEREIRAEAVLGGAAQVRRLLSIALGGLALLFLAGTAIAWVLVPGLRQLPWVWAFVLLPFIPWIGLGPVLARAVRSAGKEALEQLVGLMAKAGAGPSEDPWVSDSAPGEPVPGQSETLPKAD